MRLRPNLRSVKPDLNTEKDTIFEAVGKEVGKGYTSYY
jgi:hypothetical protein